MDTCTASEIKRELWDPLVDNIHNGQTTSYSPAHHVPSPPSSMLYNQQLPFDPLQEDPLLFSPNDAPTTVTGTPTSLVEESGDCHSNIWLSDFSSSPSDGGYEVEVIADPLGQNELFPFGFENEFLSSS